MKLKKIIAKILNKTINLYNRCFTRVNKKQVLFLSFSGKTYSDNPKCISEELHRIAPDVKIVWGFNTNNVEEKNIPDYIKCINLRNMFKRYRTYYSSAVIVSNFELPHINKSKKQYFIQTWHGDRAFKKVLYATTFFRNRKLMESIDGFCDLAIAGSEYGESQYRTAFHYNGEVMVKGTPRNDALVNISEDKKERIKKSIGICDDVKVFLFAPTLRSDIAQKKTSQNIILDVQKTLSALESKYNNKWICLVRAHPAIASLGGIEYNESVINVDKYEDMADLLMISDMLITDYSSCAGDFALVKKPIILYQADIDDYMENEREFYFNMSESPYYIANSQESLEQIIFDLDENRIVQNCEDILNFYKTTETGNASHLVAERIINWINHL